MSKRPERQAVKRSTFDQKAQLEQEVTELQRQKEAFEAVMRFAKQTQTPIWNVNDQSTKQTRNLYHIIDKKLNTSPKPSCCI